MAFFSKSTQPAREVEPLATEAALAPNALIGLRNIEKSYAHGTSRTYVLRRINLDVKEGEFVSIMGPSGAGKSTLLHIIGMHDSAWTGEYYFLDQPVHKLAAKDRAKLHKQYIGFVFQSYHLLDHLTVYENLDIPLSYRDIKKSERESMVCDILDKFAIVGKKDLYPNQLSGGQQQLVAVARAVISNPKLILADEPTGNLDRKTGGHVIDLLFGLQRRREATLILVTHDERLAGSCDRTIRMADGRVESEAEALVS
jgi:putative ABC transport system ATP-binding protein